MIRKVIGSMIDPTSPPLCAAPPAFRCRSGPGLRIGSVTDIAVFLLKVGARVDVREIEARCGLALPRPGQGAFEDGRQWLNLAPREWLVITASREGDAFARRIRTGLADRVAVLTDLSQGLVVVDVAGPNAEGVIAQGIGIDLSERFAPGSITQTRLGAISITLVRTGQDQFRIAARRPYSAYLAMWLDTTAHNATSLS